MGGSRCTYRNCTVRSGGAVHLFHYPVYDKVRCHQWLVNAQRLDFLNLKLSQLKNRVVCQHHFKDNNFMNYMKDKLTISAVPTEDGMYCSSSKTANQDELAQKQLPNCSFVSSESDGGIDKYMKQEIKANSLIYADFLTNGDVWEKKSLNETIWNNKVITKENKPHDKNKSKNKWHTIDDTQTKDESENALITLPELLNTDTNTKISEFENTLLTDFNFSSTKDIFDQNEPIKVTHDKNKFHQNVRTLDSQGKANVNQDVSILISEQDFNNILVNQENNNLIANYNSYSNPNGTNHQTSNIETPIDVNITQYENTTLIKKTKSEQPVIDNEYCAIIQNPNEQPIEIPLDQKKEVGNFLTLAHWKANKTKSEKKEMKSPKVKILSEKTISNPVIINGQLRPVSPSTIINIPKHHVQSAIDNEPKIKREETQVVSKDPPIIYNQLMESTGTWSLGDKSSSIKSVLSKNKPTSELSPKPSVVKNKMTPERIAAIEKKRNFNKKLRDIIEICLEKLDEPDKTNEDIKTVNNVKLIENKEKVQNQNISAYLSTHPDLPHGNEFMMKFLENRMKKMEETLLSKIEQNSQRIVELKRLVEPAPNIAHIHTQTPLNEEAYKKELYHEISKYLSSSANSLVFEELFINKYTQKTTNQSPLTKRRKRR